MSFQERLIWALVALLFLNFVGWWIQGNAPDPSIVVSGLIGLIGAVWGTGEVVSAVRRRNEPQPPAKPIIRKPVQKKKKQAGDDA